MVDVGDRLRQLHDDLTVLDEQLAHFVEEADDARLRSLVSETPLAEHEHREAARHAQAMQRVRTDLVTEIARFESVQDDLLDQLQRLVGSTAPSRSTSPSTSPNEP